ncbi:MAG: hypothetical protein KC978_14660 [Candidatus Omnitrophica bacterium]|nr:hypothetical protein [Candidatus Omnitrophota bacterium]
MTRPIENIGVGGTYATFAIDTTGSDYDLTTDNEGDAVALSADNEVDHGSDGDPFLGQVISVQDDIAVVQIAGVVRVPYNTGTAPSVGGGAVVDGAGKVKGSATGRGLVLAVDASAETADILL